MGADVLTILTVCSHNRTRSVMSMALLQAGFDRRVGPGRVTVHSLGFGPEGLPPIASAVEAMRRRDLDVSGHRSRSVTATRVRSADLILASQKDHVVKIAAFSPTAYRRTFTLPEFLVRIESDPLANGRAVAEWMSDLSTGRRAGDYLHSAVPEVADPTGLPQRRFEAATVGIEELCAAVVDALSLSL